VVCENRDVQVSFADASADLGLRKATERTGTIRVISIDQLDRSACGGTHVQSTGEIGPILIRKLEKIRGTVRLEFLCGLRAVARARTDFDTLSRIAQRFSAALDETPALVEAQMEASKTADKQRRKLESELARYQARELYDGADTTSTGLRVLVRSTSSGSVDTLRPLAQSFSSLPKALFLGTAGQSILIASSEDSGFDCGQWLKAAMHARGGRGGGSPRMAQGSVPDATSIESLLGELRRI
jgi:alanyl-tRNA synthetase